MSKIGLRDYVFSGGSKSEAALWGLHACITCLRIYRSLHWSLTPPVFPFICFFSRTSMVTVAHLENVGFFPYLKNHHLIMCEDPLWLWDNIFIRSLNSGVVVGGRLGQRVIISPLYPHIPSYSHLWRNIWPLQVVISVPFELVVHPADKVRIILNEISPPSQIITYCCIFC